MTHDLSEPVGNILLATDLSARCDRARDRAVLLAQRWGATLTVVHALDVLDAPNDQASRPTLDGAEARALDLMRRDFDGVDVDATFVVREGRPSAVIRDVAEENPFGLIVTGIAGNDPLGQTVLGSTVTQLSRRSDVPLLVVKRRPRRDYADIVVASDFSSASETALETALALFGAEHLTLFHAREKGLLANGADGESAARTDAATFLAAKDVSMEVIIAAGDPAVALADHAAVADADLAVIGSHGQRGLLTVLLGSTAISILDETPCDVLVVPVAGRQG